ncbi:WG repeat-containing protein [Bacteroides uniformis]|uniref:WG repeat-containing protein n=1 Tax=Bacteroides uniformis TaxID=820 RepID=UPI001CEF7749|nr:WG repeat-containing protein [Bacteroides uniformis]
MDFTECLRCTAISSGNSHPASLYVPYRYDNGNDSVQEGVYRIVDEKGRIGYADEHGNTLIEPRFAFGFPFENGKAKVTDTGEQQEVPDSDGEYHYWESDDWYYIDRKGQRIE